MQSRRIEIKWAIIFTAMMLLWMLGERLTGLHGEHIDQHYIYTNFVAIPAILIYVLALRDKRKNFYHGTMTYQQGFLTGLIMTVFITLLTPLTQYIISEIISPGYFTNAIDYAIETENMTPQKAKDFFNLKSYILQATIGAFVMGLVTTAVVAIFMRKSEKQ